MPRLIGKLLAFIINYQIQLQNLFFFQFMREIVTKKIVNKFIIYIIYLSIKKMSIINYIYVTYTFYKIQKKYATCKKVPKTSI